MSIEMNFNMKECLDKIIADERVNFRQMALMNIFAEHQALPAELKELAKDYVTLSKRRQTLLNRLYCGVYPDRALIDQNIKAAQSTLGKRA